MVGARAGSATVELIIATILAGVAAVSVAAGTALASRHTAQANRRALAVMTAMHVIDSLTATPTRTTGTTTLAPFTLAWTISPGPRSLQQIRLQISWNGAFPDSLTFETLAGPLPPIIADAP